MVALAVAYRGLSNETAKKRAQFFGGTKMSRFR